MNTPSSSRKPHGTASSPSVIGKAPAGVESEMLRVGEFGGGTWWKCAKCKVQQWERGTDRPESCAVCDLDAEVEASAYPISPDGL